MKSALKAVGYSALVLALAVVTWLHLVQWIFPITADLGRHIRNGEVAWVGHHLITTNYYSYTNPDFPTVCHHWGAGVVFYLVWKVYGFAGLSVFHAAVLMLTLGIFTFIAARAGALRSALLATVLALPLIGGRIEIRPESFSGLFAGVTFLLLYGERCHWFGRRWLWLLPLLQLVWVNVHILFPLGSVLLGIFLVDAVVRDGFRARARVLASLGVVSFLVLFLNPSGVAGVFEPLRLMQTQEYQSLAENQTIFWMIRRFPASFTFKYGLILIAATGILLLLRLMAERDLRGALVHLLVFVCFAAMALQSARSIALFGFFFIPLAAVSWERSLAVLGSRWRRTLQASTAIAAAAVIGVAALVPTSFFSPLRKFAPFFENPPQVMLIPVLASPELWTGLAPGTDGSVRFFKEANLRGRVFNNYDIGGFLIFHLFPEERPFIDNRPEAYPREFQIGVYGAMQADSEVWAAKVKEYGIEVIFFYRHDMSEWGRNFLIKRISDPEWAPIFVDDFTLIMARRGGANQVAIDKFELPKEMFGVRRVE